MKQKLTKTFAFGSLLVLTLLALVLVGGVTSSTNAEPRSETTALKNCSSKTLAGRYVAVGSGTKALGGIGPISFVGWADFDGNGSIAASDTTSLQGEILRRTYTGAYQVNDNCTGTLSFTVPAPRAFDVHFDFVISNNGDRIDFIQTDSGTELRVQANRQ